jgi:hypothetical protein
MADNKKYCLEIKGWQLATNHATISRTSDGNQNLL